MNIEDMGRREREDYFRSLPVEQRVDAVFAYERRPITRRPTTVLVNVWSPARNMNFRTNINDRCQFPDCEKPSRSRKNRASDSLCQAHAKQWTRHKQLVPLRVYAK